MVNTVLKDGGSFHGELLNSQRVNFMGFYGPSSSLISFWVYKVCNTLYNHQPTWPFGHSSLIHLSLDKAQAPGLGIWWQYRFMAALGSYQVYSPIPKQVLSHNYVCMYIIYIYMHIYLYIYMSNQPPLIHSSRTIAIITHRIGVAQKFPYRMQPYQPPTAAEEPHFS